MQAHLISNQAPSATRSSLHRAMHRLLPGMSRRLARSFRVQGLRSRLLHLRGFCFDHIDEIAVAAKRLDDVVYEAVIPRGVQRDLTTSRLEEGGPRTQLPRLAPQCRRRRPPKMRAIILARIVPFLISPTRNIPGRVAPRPRDVTLRRAHCFGREVATRVRAAMAGRVAAVLASGSRSPEISLRRERDSNPRNPCGIT